MEITYPAPPPSQLTPIQSQANGRRSEVPQRRLVAIQRKVRDDSVVQWTAVLFNSVLAFLIFSSIKQVNVALNV